MSLPSQPVAAPPVVFGDPLAVGNANLLEKVKDITGRLFTGPIDIESDSDPAEPEYTWWNVWVESAADHAVLRQLRQQWHEALIPIVADDLARFRLQVRRP